MKKVLLVLSLFIMTLLVGCFGSTTNNTEDNSLQDIKDKGVLTIGTSADYAPYEFHILNDGKDEIVGFEIDIAKEIAKDLGVELKIVDTNFEGLLTSLNSNQVDLVISGMTPTEERANAVDFSEVYYTAKHKILVRTEDLDKFNSIEDFVGVKVGVQRTSLQEMIFNEHFDGAIGVSLTKIPNIILELQNGTIDAAIVEEPVAEGYLNLYSELSVANVEIDAEDAGSAIALRKGNSSLLEQVNYTINRLKEEGLIDKFVFDATILASQQE